MQFLMDGAPIPTEEFNRLFPLEGKVLARSNQNLTLVIQDGRIALVNEVGSPLQIDAQEKLFYHQRFFNKNSKYAQPLAKALGLKRGKADLKIADATAGMLGDTLLMLGMGLQVVAFERNPVVCALGINALRELKLERNLHFGSCLDYPQELSQCDVIFYDPMFHTPNEKTAPKKAMQVFRGMIGPDEDAVDVAIKLREYTQRLVIKRPRKSPPLLPSASLCFEGKATAYDVYLR